MWTILSKEFPHCPVIVVNHIWHGFEPKSVSLPEMLSDIDGGWLKTDNFVRFI